jgi:hypothetical protein
MKKIDHKRINFLSDEILKLFSNQQTSFEDMAVILTKILVVTCKEKFDKDAKDFLIQYISRIMKDD